MVRVVAVLVTVFAVSSQAQAAKVRLLDETLTSPLTAFASDLDLDALAPDGGGGSDLAMFRVQAALLLTGGILCMVAAVAAPLVLIMGSDEPSLMPALPLAILFAVAGSLGFALGATGLQVSGSGGEVARLPETRPSARWAAGRRGTTLFAGAFAF